MTEQQQRFSLSPKTRILTPDVAGIAPLLRALGAGRSIMARPGPEPIEVLDEQPQRLYCQSSGSTGFAKTICRAPASWIISFEQDRHLFDLGHTDVVATLGSLSHSLTLFAAVTACHFGCDLAMLGGQLPRTQAQHLADLNATVLYATPAQLRLLVRALPAGGLPRLRLIVSSGGKLDATLALTLGQICPHAQVREIFGAAETSYIALSTPDTPSGSVGRAYPGVEIRIAAPDSRGVGEIWLRSPFLFTGYSEGQSAETRWEGEWLSIGEMGVMDAQGYLYPKGRRNRMVTVADKNVFPEEIEELLLARPGVRGAVVVPQADALRGHRIDVVIEGQGDVADLRQMCRSQIGDHAVPKAIWFVEALPMLPAGKPDLQALHVRVAQWRAGSGPRGADQGPA